MYLYYALGRSFTSVTVDQYGTTCAMAMAEVKSGFLHHNVRYQPVKFMFADKKDHRCKGEFRWVYSPLPQW